MEVILLQDVKGLGKKDQKVVVSDGYANNFLIKRKLAVKVSKTSEQILANQKEDARIAEENAVNEAKLVAEKLKDITLEFTLKVGQEGKTFGSISSKQICEQLSSKYGINIDKRKFIDEVTLNVIGYYNLEILLHKGVTAKVKVHLQEEK